MPSQANAPFFSCEYSQEHTSTLFETWGCEEPLPVAGKKVVVAFPGTRTLAEVTRGSSSRKPYTVRLFNMD